MTEHAWIEVGLFIVSQILIAIGIVWNRHKADIRNAALMARRDAENEAASIGRFTKNEDRIFTLDKEQQSQALEIKQLQHIELERSIMLARIDERMIHMVSSNNRIEDSVKDLVKRNSEIDRERHASK